MTMEQVFAAKQFCWIMLDNGRPPPPRVWERPESQKRSLWSICSPMAQNHQMPKLVFCVQVLASCQSCCRQIRCIGGLGWWATLLRWKIEAVNCAPASWFTCANVRWCWDPPRTQSLCPILAQDSGSPLLTRAPHAKAGAWISLDFSTSQSRPLLFLITRTRTASLIASSWFKLI